MCAFMTKCCILHLMESFPRKPQSRKKIFRKRHRRKPELRTAATGEVPYEEGYSQDVYGASIYKMNPDGSGLTRLEGYMPAEVPEGREGNSNVAAFCIDGDGGLLVLETADFYHFDEYGNYVNDGSTIKLRRLDGAGAELSAIELSGLSEGEENYYMQNMAVDADGNIYLSDGNQVITVLDPEGNVLFELTTTNWVESFIRLKDGRVAVSGYETGRVMKILDAAAKRWGESISLPLNANTVYSGGGAYDAYINDASYLMGYSLESRETTKLINWIDCDINSDSLTGLSILPDGKILCVLRSTDYSDEQYRSSIELALISEKPVSEVPQKTVLTMATLYTDYNLRAAIIDFNKKNDQYRIEVKDYSEYNTEEDYNAGLLKLNTEIIAGNIPDLLSVSSALPVRQYIAKGLLTDLYPLIDADTELGGRDALVQDFFRALETDGKLYQIASSFSISAVVGSTEVVGSEMGWTLEDLNALMATLPEDTQAFSNMTASNFLSYLLSFHMEDYLDWDTGTCSFDSESFIGLLEFSARFPAEIDWANEDRESVVDLIGAGKSLLEVIYVSGFEELQLYQAMFGGEITFKGFPCENGIGNAFTYNTALSMTTKCVNPEGAWAFMRTLLTEEYQEADRWRFPTNRVCFDQKVEEAMEKQYRTDENGEEVEAPRSSYGYDSLMVDIYASSQEQVDQILELIAQTDRVMAGDQAVMDIITFETEAFFAGQKSAAEAAHVIQNRVHIYVNEQR